DVARTVVATVSRAADLPRLRLGAGAGTRASAVGGTAIGDFGSRGLGRPHGHHREDRRGGGVGHARTGRCNRALERDAGIVRAPVGYCRVRRRGRAGEPIRRPCSGLMNRFAELLDRLAYEPGRNNKLRLMINHFRNTPDPERGWALAALTGSLTFQHAKPSLIRALIAERTDPVLFELSYDYVGDLSETVALMWPAKPPQERRPQDLALSSVVTALSSLGKSELPAPLARWLDELVESGRWALLKLVTGGSRIGVSARLAKTAAAAIGETDPQEIEQIWPALQPPYIELFAWLEGRGDKPAGSDPAPFRPVMLAHAVEDRDLEGLDPRDFLGEWKWDGIRVQAVTGRAKDGMLVVKLYSRTGEDISGAFPDLIEALPVPGAIDGELLIMRDGRVQSFNVLQQRLNRKAVNSKLLSEFPAHLRAYDLLLDGGQDLRGLPFAERRARLEQFVGRLGEPRVDLSPLVTFTSWDDLVRARAD